MARKWCVFIHFQCSPPCFTPLITPFKFTWNSIAPFITQAVLGGLKTSPYYVKTVDPPTTLSYWTLQFNGNSLKHLCKWMTELLFTNFTTENAECSVDVHITVLIMAEQIVHDTMVGDTEIPCNCTCTIARGLPSLQKKYILIILMKWHVFGWHVQPHFMSYSQIHAV